MGRAAGWIRGLFGGRKKSTSDGKEKRGWSFGRPLRERSCRDVDPRRSTAPCNACGGNGLGRAPLADEEEQSKRAIAVAAATAAVAEAAVAAAQAAAAVVRLTSRAPSHGGALWRQEDWAAVKIQSSFRGYLARKALKALKGLVKIQALVRGHIVRKQAAETLRCMHALVRAQARARAGRFPDGSKTHSHSLEQQRNGTRHHQHHATMKMNASRGKNSGSSDQKVHHSANWLDNWMDQRCWDGRESQSFSRSSKMTIDEKILEVDAGRPHANPKWRKIHHSAYSDPNTHGLIAMPDSPSLDSTVAQHSVPSPSSVEMQPSLGSIMFPLEGGGEEEPTGSPQFYSASSQQGSSRRGPFTPAKSECCRSFFGGYSDYPNYMANTESSRAKARSQSVPRQRPEYVNQMQHGRGAVLSGSSASQRSLHLRFAGKAYPGSGRLDRMGMPVV